MKNGIIKKEIAITIIIVVCLISLFLIAPKSEELDRVYNEFTEKVQEKQEEKKQEEKKEEEIKQEDKKEEEKKEEGVMKKFISVAEFVEYIEDMPNQGGGYRMLAMNDIFSEDDDFSFDIGDNDFSFEESAPTAKGGETQESERHSETNVQVLGIDEPDIVKNDGKHLFISEQNSWRWPRPMMEKTYEYDKYSSKTSVVEAFPIENLKDITDIDKAGSLLLSNDILVVLSNNGIYGFDVEDKENPKKEWEIEYKKSNYIAGARLYKGKLSENRELM